MTARESLWSGRLGLAFAAMLLVSGFSNTFPVFLPALLAEFGGSRAATAAAAGLLWVGGAVLGPAAGWLVARSNPRVVVATGLACAAGGLAGGTLAPSLPVLVLAVGVGGGIGVGLTGMAAQAALLADAYVVRRGLAMGVAFSGSMAGYVVAPAVHAAVVALGWRGALGLYVAAVLTLVPVAWRVLPSRLGTRASAGPPASQPGGVRGEPGPTAADSRGVADVLRDPAFWVLAVLFTTPPLIGYLATTQHALYFTARGFTAEEASAMLGVGGLLATAGRVLFGFLADRLGAPLAGFVSFGLSLAGLSCLLGLEVWRARPLAYAYVLLLFLPMGSRATIVSVLVGRITPPAHYGVVFGLLSVGNSLGAAVGPPLSGALYDLTGSYLAVYLVAAALLLVGLAGLAVFCRLTRR